MIDVLLDNKPVRLGARIGKGGEGEVFALEGDGTRAAKLYTVKDLSEREAKVLAMIAGGLAGKTNLVAFPIAAVRRRDGRFAGFTMQLVSGHKPLHELYSPGARKHQFPDGDFRFLVRSASNIARAVASVHATACVIGDINHSSILISKKATVALIDADSFQIETGARRFHCKVGVPEYTPPELQGQNLSAVTRTANHDCFGLAIAIFLLLFMGRHPFVGSVRKGEIPPLHEAIRDFRFVYDEDHDVGMDQPPGTPVLSDFSDSIKKYFQIAFSKDGVTRRPTALEWVSALTELERSLERCPKNPLHFTSKNATECPWCEMEETLGTILFLPALPEVLLSNSAFDPGASGFNLHALWARISSIRLPPINDAVPKFAAWNITPSAQALEAKKAPRTNTAWRAAAAIAAAVVVFALPALWFVWLPLGLFAAFGKGEGRKIDAHPFTARYTEAERRWAIELEAWRKRVRLVETHELATDLKSARDQYEALASDEKRLISEYNERRRDVQLQAFLDGFEIRKAKIDGIGPTRTTTLASYGFETAADVSNKIISTVPGFGPATTKPLIEWRSRLEQRFVFRPEQSESDRREITRIRLEVASRGAQLRKRLLNGERNLRALSARSVTAVGLDDPVLSKLHKEREQAKFDLLFLGVPLPVVHAPLVSSSPALVAPSSIRTQSVGNSPACPRCGSSMVRKMARRGRNAGRQFWSCTRFPQCRGARN